MKEHDWLKKNMCNCPLKMTFITPAHFVRESTQKLNSSGVLLSRVPQYWHYWHLGSDTLIVGAASYTKDVCSILGLCPLDASNTAPARKKVCAYCQTALCGSWGHLWLRTLLSRDLGLPLTVSTLPELARNAESWAVPQVYWNGICILKIDKSLF